MGLFNSKSKKRLKQIILVNSNASDIKGDYNFDKCDELEPAGHDDSTCNSPTVKWHKANPKEEILKIQREAEIRDIEMIYENSRIKEKDLLNLMPDHYWSGKENKLPRYVLYRGDYPGSQTENLTNLHRIKSSSLNDLTESMNFYFQSDDNCVIENQATKALCRSVSCPHFNMTYTSSLSKTENSVPIKGILKNRKTNRPNSAMLVEQREEIPNRVKMRNEPLITVNEIEHINTITEEITNNSVVPDDQIKKPSKKGVGKLLPIINLKKNDNDIFSGYFDQSPNRAQDGSLLKVNVNKKQWIKTNLDKRLNLRPTSMDLANRNILHEQDEDHRQNDFEQTRCLLNEKLSERPTLTELKKQKIIKFCDFVEIQETDNYDRSVARTWGRLTEVDKETIRNELNEFKDKEMKIHLRSKRFTKFHDSHHE